MTDEYLAPFCYLALCIKRQKRTYVMAETRRVSLQGNPEIREHTLLHAKGKRP